MSLMVCQSVVLGYLTEYFAIQDPTAEETRDAYLFAMAIALIGFCNSFLHAHTFLIGQKLGMMARIVATGAIYQKVKYQ